MIPRKSATCRNYATSTVVLHNKHKNNDEEMRERVHQMREIMKDDKNGSSHSHQEDQGMNKWDELWKNGTTPWDLGKATPVLVSELTKCNQRNSTSFLPIRVNTSTSRDDNALKALVPGCGSGYDLHTIARYFQTLDEGNIDSGGSAIQEVRRFPIVTGLDISETSLKQAHRRLCSLMEDEDGVHVHADKDLEHFNSKAKGSSQIQLKLGDFFSPTKDWASQFTLNYNIDDAHAHSSTSTISDEDESESDKDIRFDFIYDYTFFCALDPNLRGQWAERMSTLLQPKTGRLLTLIFPFLKGVNTSGSKPLRGPPFPVTVEDYKQVLEPLGFKMTVEGPCVSEYTVESRKGQEFVCWWTFDADTDIRSSL
jgi:hypothetical protein